jgi:serine/threonine-protein kinase
LDDLQHAIGPQYTLERELARGGMATVYLAHDTKHGRRVALKVLHPDLAASLGAERFRREITTAAQLHHPHILGVHDSGDTGGCLWFAMPYVEAGSLRDRLARESTLPVDEAVRLTREVADALAYAHARGVIHRDIKPENILLYEGRSALLADFGIANASDTTRLTQAGAVVGTRRYMSPEQASGWPTIDARADVYSLGVVLYEMLVGTPPGMASVPPSVPDVPEHVNAALGKALALLPSDRWASAEAFGDALQANGGVRRAPSRHRLVTAVAVGLAIVLGVGLAFAWTSKRRAPAAAAAPSAIRMAVLPFENVGDSADAYFADGVTDAVRGKLTGIAGLEVIGSTSSAQYQRTTKTTQEIGRELGVRYLLTGTVRWAKRPGGTSRVRVSSELVDAGTAADKWSQPFDAPLTDVFQVQSEIAAQVAQELQIALTPAAAQTLAVRPTADLTAYDAYLRGATLANSGAAGSGVERRVIALFTDAVTRDTTFALARAALANAQATEYANDMPSTALADSADRNSLLALARAPNLADAHTARAGYFLGVRRDPVSALHEDSVALRLAPRDPHTLRRTASVESTLGRWDAAEAHVRDAARLDPRSVIVAQELGDVLLLRREYAEAEHALTRSLAMSPTDVNVIEERLLLSLVEGDLRGGRTFLRAVSSSVDRNSLVAHVATYGDLGWALDSGDAERLLGLGVEPFDGDPGARAVAFTEQYAWRGDQRRARAYADTARVALAAQLAATPGDAQRHAILGVMLACLGRRDAAIREGQRGAQLLPIARDAYVGAYIQHLLARIYILVGEPERALDAMEPLLAVPYELTPGRLRIDPSFAPLRGNPRFERLAAGGGPTP